MAALHTLPMSPLNIPADTEHGKMRCGRTEEQHEPTAFPSPFDQDAGRQNLDCKTGSSRIVRIKHKILA